jgi:hypothetical protein
MEPYAGSIPRRLTGFGLTPKAPFTSRQTFERIRQWPSNRLRAIAARTGATIIDPAQFLCDSLTCPDRTSAGEPIYQDENHLRAGFAARHASWIDKVFEK